MSTAETLHLERPHDEFDLIVSVDMGCDSKRHR